MKTGTILLLCVVLQANGQFPTRLQSVGQIMNDVVGMSSRSFSGLLKTFGDSFDKVSNTTNHFVSGVTGGNFSAINRLEDVLKESVRRVNMTALRHEISSGIDLAGGVLVHAGDLLGMQTQVAFLNRIGSVFRKIDSPQLLNMMKALMEVIEKSRSVVKPLLERHSDGGGNTTRSVISTRLDGIADALSRPRP